MAVVAEGLEGWGLVAVEAVGWTAMTMRGWAEVKMTAGWATLRWAALGWAALG